MILHNSGKVTANYWLSEIYDEEIANAHRSDIHIHDLSMLTGYCGMVFKAANKRRGIPGKITSSPQAIYQLYATDGEFPCVCRLNELGAQAFSSLTHIWLPL